MKRIEKNPTAKIAIKKNVVRTYTVKNKTSVYLKNGTEFEIELFNPLQETVLCKIKLNGEYINGSGLVLNPGQRVFLERYLDEDRKFKYSTYEVEANNEEVDYAIDKNGDIKVEFYKKTEMNYTVNLSTNITTSDYYYDTNIMYGDKSFPTLDTLTDLSVFTCEVVDSIKETGIIEKGNISEQQFVDSYETFNDYSFHTEYIKILPDSEKVFTTKDIKHKKYCSNCGSKIKKGDKYCSQCGTKI